jgi:hypothetical protein
MNKAIKIRRTVSVAKKIVAAAMMLLLLWITGINFLYLTKSKPCSLITCTDNSGDDDDSGNACSNNPAGPDEKSPDAPVSITEEFIHEYHNPVNPDWVDAFFQHQVHETEKLCVVHTEYFSPPPEVLA